MITLHQYPGVWGLTSLSPFCIKVEFFLKAAKLPYVVQVELNPKRGPKGKMPFINLDGEKIPDSSFIIERLLVRPELKKFEIHDPVEKAQAVAMQSMIEDGLYFGLLYSRWVDPKGYQKIKEDFLKLFPKFLGGPILALIRKDLMKQSRSQGLGRHGPDEVYGIGMKQIHTLSVLLGDKDYFFENKLSYFDASAYAFLITILKQPFPSPLKDELKVHKNLIAYLERLG